MIRKLFPLFLIFAAVLVLYYPTFNVYFSQDDFFEFKASLTNGGVSEFIKFFGFPSFSERGYAFYRPIFREGLHNVYYLLFGLNSFPMHVLSWLIHFSNIALVYLLINKITKKKSVAFLTALFFGISTPNVAVLNYLAGGIEVSGAAMFVLMSLIFFWRHLDGKGEINKFLSFVFFLLSLGSHELAIITPVLLAGMIFVKESFKKFVIIVVKELWLYFVILAAFLYLDAVKIGFLQKDKQYQAVFSIKGILNSFSWYTAWAFGLPEMLIDFVHPGLKLNPSLMRYWGDYYKIIFVSFFASVALVIFVLSTLFIKSRKVFCDKKLWFFTLWFIAGLFPVVFLPMHKSTHYLSLAIPGFWAVVWYLINGLDNARLSKVYKPILVLLVIFLIILSAASARLGNNLFWAASRGRIAQNLINDVAVKYPSLPLGSAVYFTNDPSYPFIAADWGNTSKQAAFILNNEDALQLYFKDSTLKVYYEDLGGVPDNKLNIYPIVARITP